MELPRIAEAPQRDDDLEILPPAEFYTEEAARIDRLAGSSSYGYAQGHELAALLKERANSASNESAGWINQEATSPDNELATRSMLKDCLTNAAQFLDVDPRHASPDMGVLSSPLPLDLPMTRTIRDEIDKIFSVEPIAENELRFYTAINRVYLERGQQMDSGGREYVTFILHRALDHEQFLSGIGYPHQTGYEDVMTDASGTGHGASREGTLRKTVEILRLDPR